MWPSRSCDQDHWNKVSFPHPKESLYEIWVQLAQWFQRRRCLKMLTDGHRSHWYTKSSPRRLQLRWAKKDARLILVNLLVYIIEGVWYTFDHLYSMTCGNLLNFSVPRNRVGLRVNLKCQPGDSPVFEESWKHLSRIAFYDKQPEENTQITHYSALAFVMQPHPHHR